MPGDALMPYTIPMPEDSRIPGRNAEDVAIPKPVLSMVNPGGSLGESNSCGTLPTVLTTRMELGGTSSATKWELFGKSWTITGMASGGAGGTRTPCLFNAIEALSQMSYSPSRARDRPPAQRTNSSKTAAPSATGPRGVATISGLGYNRPAGLALGPS